MKLAEVIGTTPTQALAYALRERIRELGLETPDERDARMARLDEALRHLHALPLDRSLSEDEILGLDEFGVPEQQPHLTEVSGSRA